jgi:hypothetical protein
MLFAATRSHSTRPYLGEKTGVLFIIDVCEHLSQRWLEALLRRRKLLGDLRLDLLQRVQKTISTENYRHQSAGIMNSITDLLHLGLLFIIPQALGAHVDAQASNRGVPSKGVDFVVA